MKEKLTRREIIRISFAAAFLFCIKPTLLFSAVSKNPIDFTLPERLDPILKGRVPKKGGIILDVLPVVEDGSLVPVKIRVADEIAETIQIKRIHLIVDKNPDPLVFSMSINPLLGSTKFETKIRMAEPSDVRVIAETTKNELWEHKRFVKATGGCG